MRLNVHNGGTKTQTRWNRTTSRIGLDCRSVENNPLILEVQCQWARRQTTGEHAESTYITGGGNRPQRAGYLDLRTRVGNKMVAPLERAPLQRPIGVDPSAAQAQLVVQSHLRGAQEDR
jgi:hypothetical protein